MISLPETDHSPEGLSEQGLFPWGVFVRGRPVHDVTPRVSENMPEPHTGCSLRPLLLSLKGVSLPLRKLEWHRNPCPLLGVLGPGALQPGTHRKHVSLPLLLEALEGHLAHSSS